MSYSAIVHGAKYLVIRLSVRLAEAGDGTEKSTAGESRSHKATGLLGGNAARQPVATVFFIPLLRAAGTKKEDFFMSEKKFGKRLLTWALVIVMILTVVPLNVLADETDTWAAEGYAAKLDPTAEVFPAAPGNRSKSKTATQLDTSTWTSTVTLSLPSAEENVQRCCVCNG